jgi:outer membrane receptor protein involved in Fe transport
MILLIEDNQLSDYLDISKTHPDPIQPDSIKVAHIRAITGYLLFTIEITPILSILDGIKPNSRTAHHVWYDQQRKNKEKQVFIRKKQSVYRSAAKASRLCQFYLFGFISTGLLTLSSSLQASDANPYLEMDLEQLLDVKIVTASKYSQKLSETASSVTVIDKQQIKQFGYRTVGDALRSVPGFFISNNREYENVGIRGFDQSADYHGRMLVMIDGIRVNDAIYDSGFVGSELPLDIDLLEQIEVVRGPGSSMYGSNAFLAVVNLITRKGKDYQGGELAGAWSSFDTYKGRFSYGRKHDNGLEYLVSATGLSSEGPALKFPEQASDNNPSGLTKTNDEHGRQVFAKAHWGDFSFEGGYGNRNKGAPGGIYGSNFDDRGNTYQDNEAFVNLQYEKALTPKLNLTARAFYGDYDYTGLFQYGSATDNSLAHAWWTGFETRLLSTHFDRHTLIAGLEVQENWLQNQLDFYTNPYALSSQDRRDSHRIGVYLQDDIAVTEQLKLSLGARMDDYSLVNNILFSPRVGLIYQLFPETALRLQYGQAFRAANAYQQFGAYAPVKSDQNGDGIAETTDSPGLLANPSLQPEQVETYEVGLEQMIAKYWRFNATGYYMNLNKLIALQAVDNDYEQQTNVNSQTGYGGEFQLSRQWDNGIQLRTGYSVQYANNKDGSSILNIPHHIYQLNLMAPLFTPKVHGGLEMQALSSRESLVGKLPSYTRLNLNLLYQPIKSVDLSASVYDLLSDYKVDPSAEGLAVMPQEGRTFRLKLELRF